jgi:hypothetical protein
MKECGGESPPHGKTSPGSRRRPTKPRGASSAKRRRGARGPREPKDYYVLGVALGAAEREAAGGSALGIEGLRVAFLGG